ncbi:hypothetical protein G6F24_016600 [Rhizopus arrhizus]|nr:hypothetical protein G6F24_016600 [Rhizopus arrhizus]
MGDQHDGLAFLADGVGQHGFQEQPGLVVQGGKRLVQQQHVRIGQQRAGQRYALPHAARQLVRIGAQDRHHLVAQRQEIAWIAEHVADLNRQELQQRARFAGAA